jgi:hypothetical protein
MAGTKKRQRSSPKSGSVGIKVRLPSDMLADLDRWRQDLGKRLHKGPDNRPEAIRAILERHFEGARSRGLRGRAAEDLAARAINDLGDSTASEDERSKRKGRLLKGPREFRAIREDQPKSSRRKRT